MNTKIKPIQNIECQICLIPVDKSILYECINEKCKIEICNICINKIIKQKAIQNKCPFCRENIIIKVSKKEKIIRTLNEFCKFLGFMLLFSVFACSILIIGNFIVTNMFPLVIKILEEKNSFVMTFLISGIIGFGILFLTIFILAVLLFTIKENLYIRNNL